MTITPEAQGRLERLDIVVNAQCLAGTNLQLDLFEHKLALRWLSQPKMAPLFVDFVEGPLAHRRRFGGGRKQDLLKAVGLSQVSDLSIMDATAGLGRDAFVMACFGGKLTMIERDPVVRALLADGLDRGAQDPDTQHIVANMQLLFGDSKAQLAGYQGEVIFLDPMFPSREKSAKVKKDMQIFHQLLGDQDDADVLMHSAEQSDAARIVVKRPKLAPPLLDKSPSLQFAGKAGRFDVYPRRKLVEGQ